MTPDEARRHGQRRMGAMRRIGERAIRLHLLRAYVALEEGTGDLYAIIDDLLFAILDAEGQR